MRIDALRVSPQAERTGEIVAALRTALDGHLAHAAAAATMAALAPAPPCNGYWHGRPGLDYVAMPVAA